MENDNHIDKRTTVNQKGENKAHKILSKLDKEIKGSEKPTKVKYKVLIEDFAKYEHSLYGQRNSIYRKEMNKGGGGYTWYKELKGSVINHIMKDKIEYLYTAKKVVYDSKPTDRNGPSNRATSLVLIENYLKMQIPRYVRIISKTELKPPNDGKFIYKGIQIKINPELVFEFINDEGEKSIGAIKFSYNKTKPHHTNMSRKMVASLLYKYLEEHYLSEGYAIDQKMCLCVDVFKMAIVKAPIGSDVPNRIMDRVASNYKEEWDKYVERMS